MENRTRLSFTMGTDIWPTIERWAADTGFRLLESTDSRRLYQKGRGFLVAPMMFEIYNRDGEIDLQAWVRANLFVRLFALFLIPPEMGIRSGGFKMVAPRKIARNAINKLLTELGQTQIP